MSSMFCVGDVGDVSLTFLVDCRPESSPPLCGVAQGGPDDCRGHGSVDALLRGGGIVAVHG